MILFFIAKYLEKQNTSPYICSNKTERQQKNDRQKLISDFISGANAL